MSLVDKILQIFCCRTERVPEEGPEEQYQRARSLILQAVDQKTDSLLELPNLREDNAQSMVDFLNRLLCDDNLSLKSEQRKRVLHLFTKLVKAAQISPRSFRLAGVTCDLSRRPLHEGGFGSVYKGTFQGRTVCVKVVRLYPGSNSEKVLRAHAGELAIWAHVPHPNILPFYGTYLSREAEQRICIVSPWMKNGSLAQYLKVTAISRSGRITLILDIACGLGHIHDLDIIHSDLKASNVLVSGSGRAMLADFGISSVAMTGAGTTTAGDFGGTVNWMAPELLRADTMPPPTRASDMWAFACTCYEVLAGETPFKQYKPATLISNSITKNIDLSLLKPTEDGGMWPLMQQCLALEAKERPTAEDAMQFINGLNVDDDRLSIDAEFVGFSKIRPATRAPTIDYDRVHDILQKRMLGITKNELEEKAQRERERAQQGQRMRQARERERIEEREKRERERAKIEWDKPGKGSTKSERKQQERKEFEREWQAWAGEWGWSKGEWEEW